MDNQIISLFEDLEFCGEKVLSTRQEIVDLDRRRNSNREAIRNLQRASKQHYKGDERKAWIAVGNTFLKIPSAKARTFLEQDQKQLDIEVNKLRSKLKDHVNELRDREGQEELKGFGLTALSKEELGLVHQTIQDHIPPTPKYHFSQF